MIKKTAVDIYEEKSREIIMLYVNGEIDVRELLTRHHNMYYEFKAMEREQLKEMYLKGIENYDPTFKRKGGEQ